MNDEPDDRYQRITLRIPKDLHAKLMREAADRTRSMNAEIIDRLEGSFGAPDKGKLEELQTDLSRALKNYEELSTRFIDVSALATENEKRYKHVSEALNKITHILTASDDDPVIQGL